VSTANPQTLREAFPNNVIPVSAALSGGALMLKNYVPRPNSMGDMGYGIDDEWNAGGVRLRHGFE